MPGIAQNTSYLASAYTVQKVLAFFYFVALARFLGPAGVGQYVYALSFATLLSVFLDFGLRQVLIRAVAQGEATTRSLLRRLWWWTAVSGLVVLVGIVFLMGPKFGESRGLSVLVATIAMLLDAVTLTLWALFRGKQNLWYEARSFIAQYAVVVALGSWLAWQGFSVVWVVGAVLVASFVHLGLAVAAVLRSEKLLPPGETVLTWRQALKSGFPFLLAAIFSRGYGYLDVVLLTHLIDERAAGLYSAGGKIYTALQFIPGSLAAALYPAMSEKSTDESALQRIFERAMWFLYLVAVPLMVGLLTLGRPFMLLLYGQKFLASVPVIQVLALVFFFAWMGFVYNALLNATHRQSIATINMGIALVVSVAANLVLIPRFEVMGPAVAVVLSQGVLFVLGTIWAKRLQMSLSSETIRRMLKVALAGGAQAIVALILLPNAILAFVFSGAVFVAVVLITKAVGTGEWQLIKKVWPK